MVLGGGREDGFRAWLPFVILLLREACGPGRLKGVKSRGCLSQSCVGRNPE